jgi:hypothetical protein
MTRIISCTDKKCEVGEVWEADMFSPTEERYITTVIKILRISNVSEYLAFCKEHEFPVRHEMLKDAPLYYEVQVMD